ncbi:hypothetical protein AYI70_g3922 [Smittium culicis]|uniref:DUF4246 domain-containing protein n=1 Tax=Smittium culicis TaxID=133412 RepID=A0A1R1Y1N0_9FUNG|nr:hypothetical protein AYI70_g3922 [Smittium culicis]
MQELSPIFSPCAIKYAFDELDYHANNFSTYNVLPGPVDRTFISDTVIPLNLNESLICLASKLEAAMKKNLNIQLYPNNQTLDLIDPSLYPVVFGETRAISKNLEPDHVVDWKSVIGAGDISNVIHNLHNNLNSTTHSTNSVAKYDCYSSKYQWLPTEFGIDSAGNAKILSYINNLHPDTHKELYTTIEKIFQLFIPLIQNTLIDSITSNIINRSPRIPTDSYYDESFEEFSERICISEGLLTKTQSLNSKSDKFDIDDLEIDIIEDLYDRYDEEKIVEPPNNINFDPARLLNNQTTIDLSNTRLQVFVKIESITLTPENPKYHGELYHVDGIQNECIASSAIYVYDLNNVSETQLDFCVQVVDPSFEYDSDMAVELIYDLDFEGKNCFQRIGHINANLNKCIAYPNIYKHKLSPFELIDDTKPGHCKLLYFFLVDPSKRIISSAIVPPQQKSWFCTELNKSQNKVNSLPYEISQLIFNKLNWPMSSAIANDHRVKLINERNALLAKNSKSQSNIYNAM